MKRINIFTSVSVSFWSKRGVSLLIAALDGERDPIRSTLAMVSFPPPREILFVQIQATTRGRRALPARLGHDMHADGPEVLRALEGGRVGAIALAEAAFHL